MNFGVIFIYLHIFTMFIAVALTVGSGLIMQRVAATGNAPAIRTTFGAAAPLGRMSLMVYGIGFLFGLIAAITTGFNLLAPWLLISYVLFVVSSAIGRSVGKWAENVGRAAAMNQGDTPSPELQQLLSDKRVIQIMWINLIVVALIIFLMVFKPLS